MTNKNIPARATPHDRCDHIVQVAAQHFIRDGYDGASMTAIAADARVTRPLVYHYFAGKSALFEAVLARESEALLEATRPDPSRSAEENLHSALANYLDYFSPRSGRALNLRSDVAGAAPFIASAIRSNHDIEVDRIIALLGLEDSSLARSVISAWLEFVTALAQETAGDSSTSKDAIIDICMCVLYAALEPFKAVEALKTDY